MPDIFPDFVQADLALVEREVLPVYCMAVQELLSSTWARCAATWTLTCCLIQRFGAHCAVALPCAVIAAPLVISVGLVTEFSVRSIVALLVQKQAANKAKLDLLADIARSSRVEVPPELVPERRAASEALVWTHKASFGVTPLWFRRPAGSGWLWTTDFAHWQSVTEPRRRGGGFGDGDLPAASVRWLFHRLHLRDMSDHTRSSRTTHAPPPLNLPGERLPREQTPPEFLCPITHCVMTDPVVTPLGVTYERSALTQWLRASGRDPSTHEPLFTKDLYPNLALRSAIMSWCHKSTKVLPTGENTHIRTRSPARRSRNRSEAT